MNQPEILKNPLAYNGDKSTLPEQPLADSSQFSLSEGFPLLSATPKKYGGIAPKREDFNSIAYLLSLHTLFLQSGNKYRYSPLLDYNVGATVLGDDNALYYCIKANGATKPDTVQNPLASPDYWLKIMLSNGKINANNLSVSLGALATKSTITSADITNGTIVNADIANATIQGAKLVNKTITASQIADNTITATQIAPNAVGASELANNAVDTAAIINGAVTTDKIANGAVTAAKLAGNVSAILPIGFVYFQLRGQYTPDVLFGTSGKWQDISYSYAGRFFRVAGGSAAAFGSQQGGGVPNLYGTVSSDEFGYGAPIKSGVFTKTDNNSGYDSTAGGGAASIRIIFDASSYNSLYGAANEVRPINETIRVWKKVA